MGKVVRECLTWALAVGHHWETLVTGGVVTALLTALQYKKQKSIPWTLARRVFAVFLFVAFFLAWRAQYESVQTLEAQLNQKAPVFNVPPAQVVIAPPEHPSLPSAPSVEEVMARRLSLKKRLIALSREITEFEENYNKKAPKSTGIPWVDENLWKYAGAPAAEAYNRNFKLRVSKICKEATDAGLDVRELDHFEAVNITAFSHVSKLLSELAEKL